MFHNNKKLADRNLVLSEYKSIFGYEWIKGRYLLPILEGISENFIYGNVVDVGCGTQPFRIFLEKNCSSYVGVDLPGTTTKAELFADALHLPFENSTKDVCFCSWLLDDISEPSKYFQEARRILTHGGLMILAEAQSFPEHDQPHDYYRYMRNGLVHLADQVGLSMKQAWAIGGFWAQIGTQITSFYMRGAEGKIGKWIRIFVPLVNIFFLCLDKMNYIERGTHGHVVIFQKNEG